jgi:hypothetical protein
MLAHVSINPPSRALMTFFTCLCTAWLLLACSPSFNWRTVQQQGFDVAALWPCKPDRAQRPVPLGDQTLELHMLSCEASGYTFAWGSIQVPAGVDRAALLQTWQQASLNSLNAKPEQVTTWTPTVRSGLQASGWRAPGIRHDGQAITAHAVVLQHRNELHQLVIYGDPKPAVVSTWLEGIEAK